MPRKIPPYILDGKLRLELAKINAQTAKLVAAHKELIKLAKAKQLTPSGNKMLRQVIDLKNKYDKLWDKLVPKLTDVFTKKDQ